MAIKKRQESGRDQDAQPSTEFVRREPKLGEKIRAFLNCVWGLLLLPKSQGVSLRRGLTPLCLRLRPCGINCGTFSVQAALQRVVGRPRPR